MFAYSPGVTDRSAEIVGNASQNAAAINAQAMSDFGKNMGGMIASFAGQYADNKALEAKGKAYGDFMSKHGEQLGFNAEWIKDFTGRDPREQAMIGDNIIGMQNAGSWVSRNQYANTYMQPRAPRATPAYGGGGGAAATGGSSFTF